MRLLRVLLAGIAGTTAMTAFSYAMSTAENKQFREPELLNALVKRLKTRPDIKKKHLNVEGWLMHYMVGLLFSSVYDQVWQKTSINPSFLKSMVMGVTTGVFGISIWYGTFKLHPNPPKVHFKEYYAQLLIAHAIFGVFASWGYRLADAKRDQKLPVQTHAALRQPLSQLLIRY